MSLKPSDPEARSCEFLERCNRTELYQVGLRAGLDMHPAEPKELMIARILGADAPPNTDHPVDAWRGGLMKFIISHWSRLQAQLTCPARSGDPRACYGCLDSQVMTCIAGSAARYRKDIEERIKK